MNKKGMSAVIATVLIILIVVVGVGIVWKIIIPLFAELKYFSYADVSLNIVFDGYTVYDPKEHFAFVQVQRGQDEINLTGIEIGFIFGGDTVTYQSAEVPQPGGRYTYKFNFTNDSINKGAPDKVTVAPVFIINNQLKLGQILDKQPIPSLAVRLQEDGWVRAQDDSALTILRITNPDGSWNWGADGGNDPEPSCIPVEEIMNNDVDEDCDGWNNIDSCQLLSAPGNYLLMNDIEYTDLFCLGVNKVPNIYINLGGHEISSESNGIRKTIYLIGNDTGVSNGTVTGGDYGVFVTGTSMQTFSNIYIRDLNVTGIPNAVVVMDDLGGIFENVSISNINVSNSDTPLRLGFNGRNRLENLVMEDNIICGNEYPIVSGAFYLNPSGSGNIFQEIEGIDLDTWTGNLLYSGCPIEVTECQELDIENAEYILMNNIGLTDTCINISKNGITFDLNGFNITGIPKPGLPFTWLPGITIEDRTGITIQNGGVYDYGEWSGGTSGIYFVRSNNSNILNLNISSPYGYGVIIQSSSNNNLSDIRVFSSTYGLSFRSDSNNNILEDNSFCENTYQDCLEDPSATGNFGSNNVFDSGNCNANIQRTPCPIEITECGTLNQDGETYTLMNNIDADDTDAVYGMATLTCLNIDGDGITLDLQGNAVDYVGSQGNKWGIAAGGTNNKIMNGDISNFDRGVLIEGWTDNITLEDLTVTGNARGIHFGFGNGIDVYRTKLNNIIATGNSRGIMAGGMGATLYETEITNLHSCDNTNYDFVGGGETSYDTYGTGNTFTTQNAFYDAGWPVLGEHYAEC